MSEKSGDAAKSRAGSALVTRHYVKFGKTRKKSDQALSEKDDGILKIRTFESSPARISLSLGGTFPTSVDYEFAKIDVTLELPCYPEEKDACYAHAKKWVHSRFKRELIELGLIKEDADEEKAKEKDEKPAKAKKPKIKKPDPDDVDD